MPDWKRYIRENLPPLALEAEREMEIIEELAQHLESIYETALARGFSERGAYQQAIAQVVDWRVLECELTRGERSVVRNWVRGDTGGVEDRPLRKEGGRLLMGSLLQDLRYGLRAMLKKPGFTIIAVIMLALGIGANTAIFSIVNAVLLSPLPFKDPEQLVMVFTRSNRDARNWVAYPDFEDWRAQSQSFAELSAIVPQSVNLIGREEPTRVIGGFVSANFFKLLAVEAFSGRTFLPSEDQPGADRVAIVSYETWQNRLGASPNLIGQTLNLNGQVFTVVGILPATFNFAWVNCEVWLPIQYYPNFTLDRSRTSSGVMGRLKPGIKLTQAQTEMETIARRLAEQYPETNRERGITIAPMRELLVEDLRPLLLILSGAVAFLLLIVCANIANLMLARSMTRQKEIALRVALGAGQWRIVRQLLTETVLLAIIGGTAGLLIGIWTVRVLMTGSQTELPPGIDVRLDMTVLGFTFAIAILTGIAFGLVPALRFSRPDVHDALKEGGKGAGETFGSRRLRGALVVVQVSLALILLIGSGLLVRSFKALSEVNPGFNPHNVLTMEYRVPRNKYPEPGQQWAFHRQVVERVQSLPGVQSASVIFALPHSGNGSSTTFVPLGGPEHPKGQEPRALGNRADPYYFRAMEIPLIRGRVFTEQDKMDTPPVVVINQAMAERYWPGQDPIGKSIRFPEFKVTASIAGIVGNIKHHSLDEPTEAQVYIAFAQMPHIFATLVVRTAGDPMAAANAVKQAVWSVDKDQPVWKVRSLEFLLQRAVTRSRFMMRLLTVFSTLALLLAAVGVYGVISYSVSQRTHEIGVRMALGAQYRDVIRLVMGQGVKLVLIGAAIGVVGALGLRQVIQRLLFGVSATDPITFLIVTLLLMTVALLACWIPARRAAKVDPIVTLRYE
jgi:putative ABC transport system permease protein